ncbi:hypothetical protein NBCG_01564 [Nocardioidaceae bacterium Broad-1]|nr:hypothetical protein NBCG_01564 [Nocardioidaceae bacterium Broad-1]
MTNFVNYVCWSADEVIATIPTEAATPSDKVLLATHAPLTIHRSGQTAETAEAIDESDVLREFLEFPPNNGVLVASVLGESGAGKSHLVRWMHAKLKDDIDPKRHLIYLQKTETSLKDVVEQLLRDADDPEVDELRRKVAGLGSGVTQDELEHKILAELAEALRTARADTPLGKALVGDNGLRLFFLDPLFESHLLRPDSFIKRRARHAIHGRAPDEPDVPLEFTVAELPIDIADYADITEAAAATQKVFRRVASNEKMQVEAVRLLNGVLDVAVTKAISLGVGDISQAFKRLREKFVGHEIILLIEDVALIQGVRRDLLDAIIEVGVVQGEERFATVRTMMAVTPSYYREQLPETFRRRSEATAPVYVVDIDLDAEGTNDDDLVDFVGRYLNAARAGKTQIEQASPQVPNMCANCEMRPMCHEAFGTSRDDYGLYPYNRDALLRAIRASSERGGTNRLYFNPRKVLSRAVRGVLTDNASRIRQGEFPPGDFMAEETAATRLQQLPLSKRREIEENFSPQDAGRIETMLTFWGAVGTKPVDHGILDAFSHPTIPDSLRRAGVGTDSDSDSDSDSEGNEQRKPKRVGPGELPASVVSQLQAIETWSGGAVLKESIARDVRAIVRDALLARLTWLEPVIKDPDAAGIKKALPENSRTVSIVGANENLTPLPGGPVITLNRTAQTATLFQGLVLIKEGFPERAGDALARLDTIVSPRVGEAERRIISVSALDDESLVGAAASLLRGAIASGQLVSSRPKAVELVNACLWRPESMTREDAASRHPEWLAKYGEYLASRTEPIKRLLSGIGAAQGTGGVHAIDIDRFEPVVKAAHKAVVEGAVYGPPEWAADTERKLNAFVRTTRLQVDHWQGLIERIRAHLPEGVTLTATVDAISDATTRGQGHGLVLRNDLQALIHENEVARSLDDRGVKAVESLLREIGSANDLEVLRAVGTGAGRDLAQIASYLASSAEWVEAGLRKANVATTEVTDIDAEIDEVLERWRSIVKDAADG